MADGPGARIVDRVGVLVLPDTSKFKPSLRKYLERISRTERVEVGVDFDGKGLDAEVKAATTRASRGSGVKVSGDLEDGFLSQMQRDVTAALRSVEAGVPLTADGERLRRDARAKVADIQSTMSSMALEVPIDPEAGAAAKADLKAEIAELQALARLNPVNVPVAAGLSRIPSGGGGFGGLAGTPGLLPALGIGLAINGMIALGALISALPALLMSIALPIGVIALGWEGISVAAREAKPGFDALRNSVSERFAEDLAPAFSKLGEALPKLIPSFTALAGALSVAFSGVIDTLTSPEGIEKISAIIDNITAAVEILSPVLGPMVDVFLDFAVVGTQAFVDNAPALLSALESLTAAFQWLIDSGALYAAVAAFSQMLIFGMMLVGGLILVSVALAAVWTWGTQLVGLLLGSLLGAVSTANAFLVNMATTVLGQFLPLPALLQVALIGIPTLIFSIFTSAMSMATSAVGSGVGTVLGVIATLPVLILSILSTLGSSLFSLALSALGSMASGVTSGGVGVISAAVMLAVSVVSAFANLGTTLFLKGAGMVSDLASGMLSKLPTVSSAASMVAGAIAGFFRGSPVKEGPLKSWNYGQGTSGAGRKMIADLASGMSAQRKSVAAAASSVAGAVSTSSDATAGASGAGSIEERIERALAGWSPSVQLGESEFHGAMRRTNKNRKGRG